MKNKIRKILIFLQIVSFIPFFFTSFLFVVQTISDFRIILNIKHYKPEVFIVKEKIEEGGGMVGWSVSYDSIAIGTIHNTSRKLFLTHIKQYQKNVTIGDSVYVWYNEKWGPILIRKKEDTSFKVLKYLYRTTKGAILLGIPPFFIFTWILRRMKKKKLIR